MKVASISTIFFTCLTIYCIGFIVINIYHSPTSDNSLQQEHKDSSHQLDFPTIDMKSIPTTILYKFIDPDLAYKVLAQLDTFKPVDESYFVTRAGGKSNYNSAYMGFKENHNYCQEHRRYFVDNPEIFLKEIRVILEFGRGTFLRSRVIPTIANDIQKEVGNPLPKGQKESRPHTMDISANLFFTSNSMFVSRHIGRDFSCLTQGSNHIPGNHLLNRKDLAAKSSMDYKKRFEGRPECLKEIKYFPNTWLLKDPEQCQDFFKALNSPEYQKLKEERHIVYIRKVGSGSHRGEGVQPVNEAEEASLKATYENGKLCGQVPDNRIVQDYIPNPLLLDGKKFDFRMYLLIASTNPLIAFYHDGFLRVSLAQYDVKSDEKKVLLTNLALNQQIYDKAKGGFLYEGMDEEELKIAQQWSFERLKDYLLEKRIISDPNWLDNYLRPEFKKAMTHFLRMAADGFLKDSTLYELYGVDYMLDTDLNLWFIEANSGPAFDGYSKPMAKFIIKMLQDHFKVVHGLLKSRISRIIGYVNGLTEAGLVGKEASGDVKIDNLERRRKEFSILARNYFEKDYEPGVDNGFSKFLDDNLPNSRTAYGACV